MCSLFWRFPISTFFSDMQFVSVHNYYIPLHPRGSTNIAVHNLTSNDHAIIKFAAEYKVTV